MNVRKKNNIKKKESMKYQENIKCLERKNIRLKKELEELEGRFSALSEMSHEIVFIISKGLKVLYLNTFRARLLGKKPEDITGRHLSKIFSKKILVQVKDSINKVFKSKKPVYIEQVISIKDGMLYLGCWLVPLKDTKGLTTRLLGICRNLTETKRAKETLKESEVQYYKTLNSLAEAIHVVDDKLRIVLFNQSFKDWNERLGLTTDVLGKTIFDVFDFLPQRVRGEYKEVFKEGKTLVTEESTRIGDREFITETRKIPIFEGGKVVRVVTVINDITEQKQAERKRSELQRKLENTMRDLEAVFNNVDILLWSVREDENGDLFYEQVNEQFAKVEGFTPEYYNGKKISDIATPEQLKAIKNSLQRVKLGKPYSYEVEYGEGERKRYFIVRLVPFVEPDGQVHRFIGSAIDMTERKRVEDALRESEERYRTFIETAPEVIYTLSTDGSITSLNPTFEKITGWSISEWIGNSFSGIVHPDDLPIAIETFQKTLKGEAVAPYELRILSKSGKYLYGEFVSIPHIKDGKVIGEFGIARDITERKRAEEALITSEANYRAIYNAVNDAIIIRDKDTGNIIDANQKACEMYGYTVEELRGLHLSVEDLSAGRPPFTKKEAIEWIRKAAKGEPQLFEWWAKDKSGRLFWVEVNLKITNIGGKDCLVSILRDITERKRAEKIQSAIYMISESVNITENLPELYQSIHKILGELMPADNLYIALYDRQTEMITFPYYIDEFSETSMSRKQGKGLTEYVLRTGKPLHATPEVFEGLLKKGEVELYGVPSVDWIGVPLKIKDTTIGVLVVQSYKEDIRFGDEELDILMFVSTQIAMAIERKRAEEALKSSEEFSRAIIENSPLGISVRSRTGQLLSANEAWKKIWDTTDDEMRELQRERKKLIFDESDSYLGKYIPKVKRIYETGGELFIPELETKSPKQTTAKWISHYFYAIKNEDGAVIE
ncbi:MAG: PAS domain S-box protein [bacterium]